jgi:hypothetical protein
MATPGSEKIPTQSPSWLTWAYVALAIAVVLFFVWGMTRAGAMP